MSNRLVVLNGVALIDSPLYHQRTKSPDSKASATVV
jgi:hypothetical protein